MSFLSDSDSKQYVLAQGLGDAHQRQLLDFSQNDLLIVQNTSDPERFASGKKLAAWLAGDRLVFALTPADQPEVLAGLFWFSHEAFPLEAVDQEANHNAQNAHWTMGIRLYETARGKRLSLPFMKTAFEHFWRQHPSESVWLSTREDNAASQKIYTQFGFQPVARQAGKVFYLLSV